MRQAGTPSDFMLIRSVTMPANEGIPNPLAQPAVQPDCFLADHAHCCELDGGAIVLDVRSDAYLGIEAQFIPALRARVGNWPDADPSDQESSDGDRTAIGIPALEMLVGELIARGILTTSSGSTRSSPAPNPRAASAFTASSQSWRDVCFADIRRFTVALLMVVLKFRKRRLQSLLGWLHRQQSSTHVQPWSIREDVTRELNSFLWLRTWCYTASRHCLFDSLILSIYLTKASIPCTLVIGVATKPFLAHAWVQIGESVLNDTAEHAHMFKPILSIGGR
jgi:Transglutaminase-like superfamily